MLSSPYFDVYYQGADEEAARVVAKMAEQARHEVLVLFDARPEGRYSLLFYPNAVALLYSNQSLARPEGQPGIFLLPTQRGVIAHPGTTAELYQEIKREVTSFLMQEYTYGTKVGEALRTQLLLHPAMWYQEGLEEYVAQGWTFEDEMWVNSLGSEEMLALALEEAGSLNRRVRKSIWHFIAHEYGEQKLSEIVYLVNISNSVEAGVVSVLGITLNTLTARWRDYLITRAQTQRQRRVDLSAWTDIDEVALPGGWELVSFAWNSKKERLAAWMNKGGQLRLFIHEPEARDWQPSSLKMGLSASLADHLRLPELPLAWHPDGDQLATVWYGPNNELALAYWEVDSDETTYKNLAQPIRSVWDLAWSHDGKQIAASVLANGSIELAVLRAGSGEFRLLSEDVFDDREPTWSLDDRLVIFSSNRDSAGLGAARRPWQLLGSSFDLYSLELEENELTRLTKSIFTNERKPVATTSFLVKYLTDESGIWNLHAMNIFLGEQEIMSNVDIGVSTWSGDESVVVLAAPYGGKAHLYRLATNQLTAPATPELTLLRLEQIAASQARERQKKLAAAARNTPPAPPADTIAAVLPPVPADTAVAETEPPKREPLRYYIFDEEDQPYTIQRPVTEPANGESTSPTQPRRWSTTSNTRRNPEAPNLDEIDLEEKGKGNVGFAADHLLLGITYDPIANFGLHLGATFTDIHQHHKLELALLPFFNRTSFFNGRYLYQPGRIDWYGEVNYGTRQFQYQTQLLSDSLLFQYSQLRVSGGMQLPLTSRDLVDVKVGWNGLSRVDQQVRRQDLLDASDQLLHAGVSVWHRGVKYQERYRYAGWEGRAAWDSYYSLGQQQIAFHRAQAEVRHYQPVFKKIVLASRLGASFSFPNTLNQYYLGGVPDQLLVVGLENEQQNSFAANAVDTSLYSFHYQEFVTGVRGFRPITRDGSRYLLGNLELRIPMSRLMRHGLNSRALYSLEWIPFIDAGAVWTEGNPFNQKKPTDSRIISSGNVTIRLQTLKSPFLLGFGFGTRMNILGYSLRTDLAWGIDDQTLTSPMLMLSMAKNF